MIVTVKIMSLKVYALGLVNFLIIRNVLHARNIAYICNCCNIWCHPEGFGNRYYYINAQWLWLHLLLFCVNGTPFLNIYYLQPWHYAHYAVMHHECNAENNIVKGRCVDCIFLLSSKLEFIENCMRKLLTLNLWI